MTEEAKERIMCRVRAKRIWFTQQKPFSYVSLRRGLGQMVECQVSTALCPKVFTTRTHRLSGDYRVVEGSRFKAKDVSPSIEFHAEPILSFTFRDIDKFGEGDMLYALKPYMIEGLKPYMIEGYSFPELDLGIKGATMADLKDTLFKLNKKATMDSFFWVNYLTKIEAIGRRVLEAKI